jgi:hypothetical protein
MLLMERVNGSKELLKSRVATEKRDCEEMKMDRWQESVTAMRKREVAGCCAVCVVTVTPKRRLCKRSSFANTYVLSTKAIVFI